MKNLPGRKVRNRKRNRVKGGKPSSGGRGGPKPNMSYSIGNKKGTLECKAMRGGERTEVIRMLSSKSCGEDGNETTRGIRRWPLEKTGGMEGGDSTGEEEQKEGRKEKKKNSSANTKSLQLPVRTAAAKRVSRKGRD